jgi:hypothetical protein
MAVTDQRVATKKIEWALGKVGDIKRTELKPKDARILSGWHVPVTVSDGGELIVKHMRYQCRPSGKPKVYDTKYPGTYNVRRDTSADSGRIYSDSSTASCWRRRSSRT